MGIPETLRYSREHEWLRATGDEALVGITAFAAEQLGDVVYVELPVAGGQVTAGQPFGTVESVKSVSELYAPVSGTLIEVNEALADAPEQVNADPYGTGWMIRVRMSDPAELNDLLDAAAYRALVAG